MNVYIGRPQSLFCFWLKQCLQNKKIKKILRKERIHSAIIPSKTVIKPLVIFYRSIVQMTKKKKKGGEWTNEIPEKQANSPSGSEQTNSDSKSDSATIKKQPCT